MHEPPPLSGDRRRRRGRDDRCLVPAASLAPPRHPRAGSSGDGTWLTYAVNVEMTWAKLPFLGPAPQGQGGRFHALRILAVAQQGHRRDRHA